VAKFRKNHSSQSTNGEKRTGSLFQGNKMNVFRLIIGLIFIFIVLYLLSQIKIDTWGDSQSAHQEQDVTLSDEVIDGAAKSFLPESTTGEVIKHKYYTLSYSSISSLDQYSQTVILSRKSGEIRCLFLICFIKSY